MDPRDKPDLLMRVGEHLGLTLTPQQHEQLQRYQRFLADEAVAAGGIGPGEVNRLPDRHIADSMMFLAGVPDTARSLVDIGSGVGLPGIPIAICKTDIAVSVVDRSQRRADLAGRAVRILGLENVAITTGEAQNSLGRFDVATFRASLPIDPAARLVAGMGAGCTGLLGVSRLSDKPSIPDPPPGMRFRLTEESRGVLDSPFWLLRMTLA